MGQDYDLGLCLLDFVPNLAFLVGGYFLVQLIRLKKRRFPMVMMVAGTSLVVLGGTLKAVWKLLYTINVGDFQLLSELQFVLLAPGFLAMLVGVIAVARHESAALRTTLVGMAAWKIPLLATMTICSLGMQGILGYMAFRRKMHVAAVMYGVAILCMLAMAGMASAEQTVGRQWVEEGINSAGQIAFAVGSYLLFLRFKMDTVNKTGLMVEGSSVVQPVLTGGKAAPSD